MISLLFSIGIRLSSTYKLRAELEKALSFQNQYIDIYSCSFSSSGKGYWVLNKCSINSSYFYFVFYQKHLRQTNNTPPFYLSNVIYRYHMTQLCCMKFSKGESRRGGIERAIYLYFQLATKVITVIHALLMVYQTVFTPF